jgi:hypothetical protein
MAAKTAKSRPAATRRKSSRWSGEVTRNSNALDLEASVFKKEKPRDIALSLKRSAEASKRRKGTAFQSAMSMLTFYINRAGKNLPKGRLQTLDKAKTELRKVFGRET